MRSVSIQVADIAVNLDSAVSIDRFGDYGLYKDFIAPPVSNADCRLELTISPAPKMDYDIGSFNALGVWRLSKSGEDNILQLGPPPKRGLPKNVVVFNSEYSAGKMYQKSVFELFRRFIDQFLFINLLSRREGFLLHAAGAVWKGKGLCFIGRPGAGKSTLLKLFSERVERKCLLNDDRLALRRFGGGWRVFGTPWHGEFPVACPDGADLGTLFFIRHADHNYLRRLSAGETCRHLMVHGFIPLWDGAAMRDVLDSFQDLTSNIPAFELGFVPDESAIDFIISAL